MIRNSWFAAAFMVLAVSGAGLRGAETTATVKRDRVNVRGQPSVIGEVITQLRNGEVVTVLDTVKPDRPKAGSPTEWLKIQMPANTPVWLNASFVDPNTKAVKVKRLNLRAGPGENFSVVGTLAKDTVVKEIRVVDDWMEIETPAGAFAFVAADFLQKSSESPALAPPPASQAPAPAAETRAPASPAAKPLSEPEPVPPPAPTPPPQPAPTPVPAAQQAEKEVVIAQEQKAADTRPAPAATEAKAPVLEPPATAESGGPGPLTKRIVRREGIVKTTLSIQAPTSFELTSLETKKTINYLNPGSADQKLKPLKGRRVIVTGEEVIDPRWPKTPVINLETIELAP